MIDNAPSDDRLKVLGLNTNLEGLEEAGEPGREATVFRYRRPANLKGTKGMTPLARSDIVFSAVQTIREGGENSMHSHTGMDGFWFVLNGRARFYGDGDKVIAEIGQHEGVFVPRNVPYWFESVGDELLELLQVEAIDKTVKNRVIRHAPKKTLSLEVFRQEGELIGTMGKTP
jgi:mannose-6-phosphate isomerase-like protein (cupin superfamily)